MNSLVSFAPPNHFEGLAGNSQQSCQLNLIHSPCRPLIVASWSPARFSVISAMSELLTQTAAPVISSIADLLGSSLPLPGGADWSPRGH